MYAAALAGLLFGVGVTRVTAYDAWWHLTTGWVIANLHIIPRFDLFSYSAFGAPWITYEWLFELIQWLIYDHAGFYGLAAMKLVLACACTWLLFRTASYLTRSRSAALWGTIVFLWAAAPRIMDRPFLLGMCILAAYCLILHKFVRTGTKWIWTMPFLQLIWINSHGGALLGLQVVFCFALGESIQALAEKRLGAGPAIPAERRRILWVTWLLCAGACVINPWGFEVFTFPFELAKMSSILGNTEEWLSLVHPRMGGFIPPIIALAWLAIGALSFISNARNARASHLMLFVMSSLLLLKGHRFVPEFLIVNVPLAMANFTPLAQRIKPARGGELYAWAQLALAFAISSLTLAFGIPVTVKGEMMRQVGIGTTAEFAPARMVDFLERNNIHGRVFNDEGLGEYLIFRRWPNELVFIDGRTPVFGDKLIGEYLDAFRNSRNFEALDRKYQFDYIVLPWFRAWEQRFFHNYLWKSGTWRLVYAGNDGFVYLRDTPKFKELIARLALKENPVVTAMEKEQKVKAEERKPQ